MIEDALVRAAGGIVLRDDAAERVVAVVHRPRYDDWAFPKGKLLDREREEDAALREVFEETGFRCRLVEHVGAVTYTDLRGRPKVVRYWTMAPEEGAFVPTQEVDDLRWVTTDEADRLLTYRHDRDLLRSAIGKTTHPPVYLVRHAKAGIRGRWSGPDERRPLTRRGRRQARRLIERFERLEVERIVSSPLDRCVQTVEPLAHARGLEVERAGGLAEGHPVDEMLAFLRSLDDRPTVLCGHGREIETLVRLLESGGVDVESPRGIAKGSVWVLDRRDARFVSARYLPPPPG